MLLRFVGVSLLSAAGPAAQVPSRIGNEIPAVLGSTHPNGTALGAAEAGGLSPGELDALPGGAGAAGEGGSAAAGEGKAGSGGGGGGGDASSLLHGSDAALEGLVNASSAVVLVALMGAAFALFLCVRRRARAGGRLARAPGGEGWAAVGVPGLGMGTGARGGKHERGGSRGEARGEARRGYEGAAHGGGEDEDDDGAEGGAHELDELMSRRGAGAAGAQGAYRDESAEDDDALGRRAGSRGGPLGRRDEEEKVFGLGDDDDEDEDGAGMPRRHR